MRIDVCLPFFPHLNNIPFSACKRILILWAVVFISSIPVLNQLVAQEVSNKPIPVFEVSNQTLDAVLKRLAYESNLRFTYEANDPVMDTKVTMKCEDEFPLTILSRLLENTGHAYKQIGNQIVIYINKDSNELLLANESHDESKEHSNIPDVVIQEPTNYNPEPIIEAVVLKDTVIKIQIDTVRITDTVFIEKEKPRKTPIAKIKNLPVDYFNPNASRENGWAATIYFAPIMSDFSLGKLTDEWDIRNFSFGMEAIRMFNNWNISGGVKLTHFAGKFNHSYSITEGGYFVSDTVDEYYTVNQTDTTWYYVTDSTYLPLDHREYSYNVNNRIGYLELVLSASYDYYSNRKVRLYIKGGLQAGVLIYSTGLAVPDANKPIGVDFADLNFNNLSFSALAGAGIKYNINKYIDFNAEFYYFNNFTEVVVDYPFDKKIRGVGLKMGMIYYF